MAIVDWVLSCTSVFCSTFSLTGGVELLGDSFPTFVWFGGDP